jgi:type IV pilus assembly protein PilC
MKNSVDIVESLSIASAAISFIPYQKALVIIQEEVKKGKTIEEGIDLADPKEKLFDPTVKAMIRVGEKTGSLYNSLLYISEYYEEEVDDITKNMATILEPILLIIIAVVVAFVAIAIISPMYQILNYINT